MPAGLVSGEDPLSTSKMMPWTLHPPAWRKHSSSHGRRTKEERESPLSKALLFKVLNPPMREEPSWPYHLLKASPPKTITMAITFQRKFWKCTFGKKHSKHRNMCCPLGLEPGPHSCLCHYGSTFRPPLKQVLKSLNTSAPWKCQDPRWPLMAK